MKQLKNHFARFVALFAFVAISTIGFQNCGQTFQDSFGSNAGQGQNTLGSGGGTRVPRPNPQDPIQGGILNSGDPQFRVALRSSSPQASDLSRQASPLSVLIVELQLSDGSSDNSKSKNRRLKLSVVPRGSTNLEADSFGSIDTVTTDTGVVPASGGAIPISKPLIDKTTYQVSVEIIGTDPKQVVTPFEFQFGLTTPPTNPDQTQQGICDRVKSQVDALDGATYPFPNISVKRDDYFMRTRGISGSPRQISVSDGTPDFFNEAKQIQTVLLSSGIEETTEQDLNFIYYPNWDLAREITSRYPGCQMAETWVIFRKGKPTDGIFCRETSTSPWKTAFATPGSEIDEASPFFGFGRMDDPAVRTDRCAHSLTMICPQFRSVGRYSIGLIASKYASTPLFMAELSLRTEMARDHGLSVPTWEVAACRWRAGKSVLGITLTDP